METLKINISHIKNIKKAELEVPFDNGIYTFVGANGCGKSSLMLCMAQLLSKYQLRKLQDGDIDNNSFVEYRVGGLYKNGVGIHQVI